MRRLGFTGRIIIILIATGLAVVTAVFATQVLASQANRSVTADLVRSVDRLELLSLVSDELGYGGGIHNFKNYVLRDGLYYGRANASFARAEDAINALRSLSNDDDQVEALDTLLLTVQAYRHNLELARDLHGRGFDPVDIDLVVRVDDSPAMSALYELEQDVVSARALADENARAALSRLDYAALITLALGIIIGLAMLLILRFSRQQSRKLYLKNKELDAAIQAKSRFLANMSHELRTPLTGVIGLSKLLSRTSLDDRQSKLVTTLTSSGESMRAIVDDILDLSKIEAGKMELENEQVAPATIIKQAADLFRAAATDEQITLETQIEPALEAPYQLDSLRVGQVLSNLLSNAIKFAPGGRVMISGKRDGAHLVFTVSDTGVGMTPEQQERVFGNYVQGDSSVSRQYGGTGLGLAICMRLIELMGGDIHVASEVGEGTRFTVLLPALQAETIALDADDPEETIQPTQASLSLLIVDDIETNRIVLSGLLRDHAASIDTASDGQEALDKYDAKQYDAIFTDINMPVMDGVELIRKIRAREDGGNTHRLPIFAVTANAYEEQRKTYYDAGVDDVLTKPFTQSALDRAIHSIPATRSDPA